MIDVEFNIVKTSLLLGLDFDEREPTFREKIYNYLLAKGIIKSENYIFGGNK